MNPAINLSDNYEGRDQDGGAASSACSWAPDSFVCFRDLSMFMLSILVLA